MFGLYCKKEQKTSMSLNKLNKFPSREQMNTYVFLVELEKEEEIWTAVVPILPGCNLLIY